MMMFEAEAPSLDPEENGFTNYYSNFDTMFNNGENGMSIDYDGNNNNNNSNTQIVLNEQNELALVTQPFNSAFPWFTYNSVTPDSTVVVTDVTSPTSYSDDDDEDFDITKERSSKRPKKQSSPSSTSSGVIVAKKPARKRPPRGRSILTDGEKEVAKRKRELAQEEIGAIKELLVKTAAAATVAPVEPLLSEATTRMMTNVVNQQDHIGTLTNHILSMGLEYRNGLLAIDKSYRDEKECLQNAVNSLKLNLLTSTESELQLKERVTQLENDKAMLTKINECDIELKTRIIELEHELQHLRVHSKESATRSTEELTASKETVRQLENEVIALHTQSRVDLAVSNERIRHLESQLLTANLAAANERILELEGKKAAVVPEKSIVANQPKKELGTSKPKSTKMVPIKLEETRTQPCALYTWSVVEIASPKCTELYGFDAKQIQSLYTHISTIRNAAIDETRNKRGCKSTIPDGVLFLVFLYFFKHYATMRGMQEKFEISPAQLQSSLLKTVTSHSKALFRASNQREAAFMENDVRVYRCYFFVVNKPVDPALSNKYYSPLYKLHGLFIHCIHHKNGSGKVLEYYTSMRKNVESEWLQSFIDGDEENGDEEGEEGNYEERMKSKFEIAVAKYRGNLTELPNIVECVLALTNFDIEYGNAIEISNIEVEIED